MFPHFATDSGRRRSGWWAAGLAALVLGAVAGPPVARADIQAPIEPVGAQLQTPPPDQVSGPVIPVVLNAETPPPEQLVSPELVAAIHALIRSVVNDASQLVLLETAPAPVMAVAPATVKAAPGPLSARFALTVGVNRSLDVPVLGGVSIGVQLRVTATVDGRLVAEQLFQANPADITALRGPVAAFLGRALSAPVSLGPVSLGPVSSGTGTHAAPVSLPTNTAANTPESPRLKLWLDSSDGDQIRLGSKMVVFYQPSHDGYFSLYHFGSARTIQRVFPNRAQSDNFIRAGQIYRFPATGHLSFSGQPGVESFRAVLTLYPSNTTRQQGDGASFKGDPLRVVPTHFPLVFTDGDMSRFFALPAHLFAESFIAYELKR